LTHRHLTPEARQECGGAYPARIRGLLSRHRYR
jgi:hypothetical protein